jgi:hypothetical protein
MVTTRHLPGVGDPPEGDIILKRQPHIRGIILRKDRDLPGTLLAG